MKNILIILLLFTCTARAQIVINEHSTFSTVTTDATSFGFTGITFTAGKLYLFVSTSSGTTNNGTLTTTTTTWNNVVNNGNSTRRVQVFRFMPTSTVTGEDVSLGSFGGGSTGYSVVIYEISGVAAGANGANAIIQAESNTGIASANPTITMNPLTGVNNAVMLFFTSSVNPFGGTPEAGWTEAEDDGYSTPDNGTYIMYRIATTDNTPSITMATADWVNISIELQIATARRRIIID